MQNWWMNLLVQVLFQLLSKNKTLESETSSATCCSSSNPQRTVAVVTKQRIFLDTEQRDQKIMR